MTIEEKRRELFEDGINIRTRSRNEHGDYVLPEVRDRWDGFNAALDAVVIELPETYQCGDEQYHSMAGMCAEEVRAAIESTGLGLKVKS